MKRAAVADVAGGPTREGRVGCEWREKKKVAKLNMLQHTHTHSQHEVEDGDAAGGFGKFEGLKKVARRTLAAWGCGQQASGAAWLGGSPRSKFLHPASRVAASQQRKISLQRPRAAFLRLSMRLSAPRHANTEAHSSLCVDTQASLTLSLFLFLVQSRCVPVPKLGQV